MNKEESNASGKVIDSLINFETIKLFGKKQLAIIFRKEIFNSDQSLIVGKEKHEADRYDLSLKKFQQASVRTQTSLSALNFGQNFIFSCGLTTIMCMTVNDISAGKEINFLGMLCG